MAFGYWKGSKRGDMETKVEKFMREKAAEPVPETGDPRLKSWDYSQPMVSHQIPDEKILV